MRRRQTCVLSRGELYICSCFPIADSPFDYSVSAYVESRGFGWWMAGLRLLCEPNSRSQLFRLLKESDGGGGAGDAGGGNCHELIRRGFSQSNCKFLPSKANHSEVLIARADEDGCVLLTTVTDGIETRSLPNRQVNSTGIGMSKMNGIVLVNVAAKPVSSSTKKASWSNAEV